MRMVGFTQKALVHLATGGWRKYAALAYLCVATCVLAVYLMGRQVSGAVVRNAPDLLLSIAAALRWNKIHRSLLVILLSSPDTRTLHGRLLPSPAEVHVLWRLLT